jgi:hypothetical protein
MLIVGRLTAPGWAHELTPRAIVVRLYGIGIGIGIGIGSGMAAQYKGNRE